MVLFYASPNPTRVLHFPPGAAHTAGTFRRKVFVILKPWLLQPKGCLKRSSKGLSSQLSVHLAKPQTPWAVCPALSLLCLPKSELTTLSAHTKSSYPLSFQGCTNLLACWLIALGQESFEGSEVTTLCAPGKASGTQLCCCVSKFECSASAKKRVLKGLRSKCSVHRQSSTDLPKVVKAL